MTGYKYVARSSLERLAPAHRFSLVVASQAARHRVACRLSSYRKPLVAVSQAARRLSLMTCDSAPVFGFNLSLVTRHPSL
ncbi:MAG TPA: hypothetical protein VF634_07165, partial [Pyrinomonadaceae bacterium]